MEQHALLQTELACFFMYPAASNCQKSCYLERHQRQELEVLLMRNFDGKDGESLTPQHNPTGLLCSF